MVSFKRTASLALSLLPVVASVCDKDTFDFTSFHWKTCDLAGGPVSASDEAKCKVEDVNSECATCPGFDSFLEVGDCSQTKCGLDPKQKTVLCEDPKDKCEDIDTDACNMFFEEYDMALKLAGMGCKTSVYDVYQEAIRLGIVSKDRIREEKPDYTDQEVEDAENLMKNFRIGDGCPVTCNLCEEEIAMKVTVPAESIPAGETAATLGKKFVGVTCLAKNYFLPPVTDSTNEYDLEFPVDFEGCPFKLETEESGRRLEEDGSVSFVMVADNAAMNKLETDMIDEDSDFNQVGSALLPDFIGENKTVTTEAEKDIAEPGLGIIGLIAMVVVVLILICCCCCVCCCRYVCKCCCRCGMDKKPKSASTQGVGLEMN